jgi:hypothetical protein
LAAREPVTATAASDLQGSFVYFIGLKESSRSAAVEELQLLPTQVQIPGEVSSSVAVSGRQTGTGAMGRASDLAFADGPEPTTDQLLAFFEQEV